MKKIFLAAGMLAMLYSCSTSNKGEASNPFFSEYKTPFQVPDFDAIAFEHYLPAFEKGMADQAQEIDAIIKNRAMPDFDNTIAALDESGKLLSKVSRVFFGLNGACTTEEMQKLNREIAPMLSKHYDDINLNPLLFDRVKQVWDRRADFNLNPAQAKLLEDTYKGFVNGGANLNAEDQEKLRNLNSQISENQIKFEQNVLTETNAYELTIDNKEDLAGLPEGVIAAAATTAKEKGKDGKWVFTLQNPSVMPFLQFADNRELREHIYNAYINRCNNGNDADNNEVIKQLVDLRLQKAKLMGANNYANFALEERMAKNDTNVYKLLDQLWPFAVAKANDEAKALQATMNRSGVQGELKGWDWRYYNEKVMKEKFDLDENQIRPYLTLDN
ncbi:MAG: M3 family metallopeptidase, partial [Bacteroidales bacterium]